MPTSMNRLIETNEVRLKPGVSEAKTSTVVTEEDRVICGIKGCGKVHIGHDVNKPRCKVQGI